MKNARDIIPATWKPVEEAVLCFIRDRKEEKVLLIHKKTGLGAGLINAPGGRIDPGETPEEAAVRET
ncbi:MAG: NUDIX hydrolase, partial [Spirochaetes bacterium]